MPRTFPVSLRRVLAEMHVFDAAVGVLTSPSGTEKVERTLEALDLLDRGLLEIRGPQPPLLVFSPNDGRAPPGHTLARTGTQVCPAASHPTAREVRDRFVSVSCICTRSCT